MEDAKPEQHNQSQDWQRVDARILGQILAAQNVMFALPDETRIAEFLSQALSGVPGITSCFVCLGNHPAPTGLSSEICRACTTLRKKEDVTQRMPNNIFCGLTAREDLRILSLRTNDHTFGFFVFQTDPSGTFEPYWPFISNLANHVALSLENRMQKLLLEKSRDELESSVKERTEELRKEVAERHMAQERLQEKALLLEEEIEKRQNAQEKLEKMNDELELRVRERTADLMAKSDELDQKNRELERFNKLFIGRELKMVELKERIRRLETQQEKNKVLHP